MRAIIRRISCTLLAGAALASTGCGLLDAVPGTWSGQIQLLQFPTGSNAIHLTIATATASSVTGKVLFGGGPMLAPATNAAALYPPSAATLPANDTPEGGLDIEGFEYTIAEGSFAGSQLQFEVDVSELWESWCKLQTPVVMETPHPTPGAPTTFWCGPPGVPPNGTNAQNQCPGFCTCTETACTAQPVSVSPISFDMNQSGDQLSGSVLGVTVQGDDVRELVMTKQ